MPQDPQLISLQKPEKLSKVLEADRQDDCLSCRLTGRALFQILCWALGGFADDFGNIQAPRRSLD